MQFKLLTLAFAAIAVVNGAAIEEREARHRPIVIRPPVCGGNTIAACCQTDSTKGSADCLSPGSPTSIKKFRAFCSATGRTAECCETLVMGAGTGCQDI